MADKISWFDANGTEHVFNTDIKVLDGMNGHFMPPISFVEEQVPFHEGSKLRQVRVEPRDVDIPVYIEYKNEIELRQKMRKTLRIFNPLKADGKLKVFAPDGSQRELFCRYSTGLEGREDVDEKGFYWQKIILVFHAFDPFWYDTVTKVETFTTGQPATFFPFFPLRLSASSVFADATIDNTGDVESYPEWIIKGAGENIVLRNLTTGQLLQLNTSLQVGESITIDTRPNKQTIRKSDGTNLFYTISDESSLWSLEAGLNNIRIEMGNSTADSSVQLSYKNRYWSV
ncbi:phage distal tail protein [Rossellomorea sp. BNER]|uniref:phage distal tail protein n=1 Tax=Rossellomorea sp. BNER TaxID=2962031 RepID=UPI003AF25433|nr:phage tail family protein [Rossellomorea sp. BNER]